MGTSSEKEGSLSNVSSLDLLPFQHAFCPTSPAEKPSLSHVPHWPASLTVKTMENLLSKHTRWLKAQILHLDLPKCSSSYLQVIACSTEPGLWDRTSACGSQPFVTGKSVHKKNVQLQMT